LSFERLDPARHDRAGFYSGEPSLDAYLKQRASQDMKRQVAVCYVLCEEGAREIIGYYTLSAFAIEAQDLAADVVAKLPRYPLLPAALLGRLAVGQKYRGQNRGKMLVLDAVQRVCRSDVAAMALVADAINERVAASFYAPLGFLPIPNRPLRLYLPLNRVRTAF
jgi:predicted N-acetyltransferase YhbS